MKRPALMCVDIHSFTSGSKWTGAANVPAGIPS
jgi:hypothetical protein